MIWSYPQSLLQCGFIGYICCLNNPASSRDGESLSITLDELRDVRIVGAKVFDNTASVTVEFQSTQTRILTDSDGTTIEDEDTGTRDLIDIWTFERDLTLDDPNWKLAETESPDEE